MVRSAWTRRIAAVLAAVVALCCVIGAVRAADPFEIYTIVPLTGPGAFAGKELQTSLQGLEAYLNRTGGIRGRPVKFVFQDDASNPAQTVQLTNGLIAKHVAAFIGPALGGSCLAVGPLIEKNGPVSFCYSNAIHPAAGSFQFTCCPSTLDQTIAIVRYMRARGWNKIGFLGTVDASGQDGEKMLDEVLKRPENRPVSVVAREHFTATDVSTSAQIASIKAAGAQVLYVYTTGTPLGTALRSANDGGLGLPVVTHSGNTIPAQIRGYAAFVPKELYLSSTGSQALEQVTNRGQRAAIDVYFKEMAALGERPTAIKVIAWDAGLLVANAYRAVGTDATADQIRSYLANLRGLSGAWGTYDFRSVPQRGLSGDNIYMVRWDEAKGDFTAVSRGGGEPVSVR
jgi:branched-chain amino acid transport system substrate-binding protein